MHNFKGVIDLTWKGVGGWLKKIALKRGFFIKGYHPIYIQESQNSKIIEFIGLGGKTFLLKKTAKLIGLKKIKPNFSSYDQEIIVYNDFLRAFHELSIEVNDHFKRYSQLLDTLTLLNKYRAFDQYWDEGIVKRNLNLILRMCESEPNSVIPFLKNIAFIVVLPKSNLLIAKRYTNRDGLKNIKSKIDWIEQYRMQVLDFLKILDKHAIEYILVDGEDVNRNLTQIKAFINNLQGDHKF